MKKPICQSKKNGRYCRRWRPFKYLRACVIPKEPPPSHHLWCASRIVIIQNPSPPSLPSSLFLLLLLPFRPAPFFPPPPPFLRPLLTRCITNTRTASSSSPARTAKMITHTGTGMGAGWMPQVTSVATCRGKKVLGLKNSAATRMPALF